MSDELDSYRKDAERYRHIKDINSEFVVMDHKRGGYLLVEQMDAAIDASMLDEREKK